MLDYLFKRQTPPSTACPPFQLCVRQSQCWDADNESSNTAMCVRFSFAMISIGLFFVVSGELGLFTRFNKILKRRTKNRNSKKVKRNVSADAMLLRRSRFDSKGTESQDEPERSGLLEAERNARAELQEFEETEEEIRQTFSDPAFITTRRTEVNFVKDNIDPTLRLPEAYDTEYSPQANFPASGFLIQGFWTAIKTSVLFSNCWLSCFGKYTYTVCWATGYGCTHMLH